MSNRRHRNAPHSQPDLIDPGRRALLGGLASLGLASPLWAKAGLLDSPPVPARQAGGIRFSFRELPFRLETDETPTHPHVPSTMAGGVAVFDYNGDGRPDIFFTNGANIQTLRKDHRKFRNCLLRNDGHGKFTDVTEAAGLAGFGFDNGVAVGDYDNDGHPDLFVAGLHRNTLYHNNGDGTFTDVTKAAGLDNALDPVHGPLWASAAAWVDVNNDGLLDLFVVNYLRWEFATEPVCNLAGGADYCTPNFYKGQPCRLYLNRGKGRFEDVSEAWGLRKHVGKGMGVGVADFDLDGRPDLFVSNDSSYNFLFQNTGAKFEEVAFEKGVALIADGNFISAMGVDFRDFNNDGYPDIATVALNFQTFPLFENHRGKTFDDITDSSGMGALSRNKAGYGVILADLDNDGWKDSFVSCGHVEMRNAPGQPVSQHNAVFRNLGRSGKWQALARESGLLSGPAGRHRGLAMGDFNGNGRLDLVTTAIGASAELWSNESDGGNWIRFRLRGTKSNRDAIGAVVRIQTRAGEQWNHMTTSCGYASSSHGPVHFGLGQESRVQNVEIRWPSGAVQRLSKLRGGSVVTVREPEK